MDATGDLGVGDGGGNGFGGGGDGLAHFPVDVRTYLGKRTGRGCVNDSS